MLKQPYILAILLTCYLLTYVVLLHLNILPDVTMIMFFLSPFLIITLVYSILCYGTYDGPELKDNEHWGYQDRQPK